MGCPYEERPVRADAAALLRDRPVVLVGEGLQELVQNVFFTFDKNFRSSIEQMLL